ncbi:MAG TPA: hypothetical protein VFN49_09440 [Candidatus Aquilonibacter sp.]|nr:hypothetical protein [Candidatus Aquilonibacter sp.]
MNASPLALRATQGSSLLLYESENGAVRAALRYARATPLRMEFALDVVNATPEPILATIYALARNGQEIPLAPYSFWIDARSEGFLHVPLSWVMALTCTALSVRLQGRNVHQRLEAAMPRPASFVWFLAGGAAVAIVAAVLVSGQPRITSLDVPASAIAGASIDVRYATRGVGSTQWELRDIRGARVAGGSAPSDPIRVNVPRVTTQSAYALTVRSSGPFGSAAATRPMIVMTPRPAVAPPRIISFSVDRAAVADGSAVTVRYRVSADSGDVLAVDAQGTIWSQAAIRSSGVTQLSLPMFHRNKELQIRLVVRRGPQLAAAGIGVEAIAQ